MNAIWIVVLLGAAMLAAVVITSWRHRVDVAELGTVSEHWLSEQRANDRHYSER